MSTTTNNDILHKLNFKVADASESYKSRRKLQMVKFFTFSALTIFASRFAYRATITRQYIPTLFQGNHSPPLSYNFTTDAAVAVGTGTLLCGSVTGMAVFGVCWILDVSNIKEFGWKMKSMFGGWDSEKRLSEMEMDEESSYIQDSLNDILEGKYDFEEEEPVSEASK